MYLSAKWFHFCRPGAEGRQPLPERRNGYVRGRARALKFCGYSFPVGLRQCQMVAKLFGS